MAKTNGTAPQLRSFLLEAKHERVRLRQDSDVDSVVGDETLLGAIGGEGTTETNEARLGADETRGPMSARSFGQESASAGGDCSVGDGGDNRNNNGVDRNSNGVDSDHDESEATDDVIIVQPLGCLRNVRQLCVGPQGFNTAMVATVWFCLR
jgi:hypothetical protein